MSRGDKLFLAGVFVAALGWALVASHGVRLWDDDYAGWFRYALPKSGLRLVLEWLSPLSSRPEGWAFQDRPAQALAYKLLHALFSYDATAFFAFKSLFWAGLATLASAWVLCIGRSRPAALVPALVLSTSPSVMASFVWHADYGVVAECALSGALLACFLLWEGEPRRLDVKWWLAFALVYLGFGTKAHLKCVPLVLLVYQALFLGKEKRVYWLPLAALALAIPWGPRLFGEVVPWWPGSGGSASWMPQAWSLARVGAHLWSGFSLWPRELPQSLAQELGALLPLGAALAAGLVLRRGELAPPLKRALALGHVWLAAMVLVTGALPDLPELFSVRYGMLLLAPASVLLGLACAACRPWLAKRPWLALPGLAALGAALWCNGAQAIAYRDLLGSMTRAVDGCYAFVDQHDDRAPLLCLPGFLGFDYRPDSSVVTRRRSVSSLAEAEALARERPWAVSWEPIFAASLGLVRVFDGAEGFALRARPDLPRAYLYRIAAGPQSDAPSLVQRFQEGLAAWGDDARFLALFEALVRDAPTVQVRYNYALALRCNGRLDEAVREWKRLVAEGVHDPGTLGSALEAARALPDPEFAAELEALLAARATGQG